MQTTVLDYVGPAKLSDGKESANHYEHRHALSRQYTSPFGRALRAMAEGWELWALAYQDRCECCIGTDGVLGEHWQAVGEGLRRLLDGDTGGWDAGSLNHNIRRIMREHGCKLALGPAASAIASTASAKSASR
jgi:hypothetical protein